MLKNKTNRRQSSDAKVDILLPYWGEFKLLKQAVESVIAQTEKSWRLLIIDDAYPSREAEAYYKNIDDKRITYIRHAQNIGITKNFNYSVDSTTAKHCVIFGCDDILLPNYLEVALSKIGSADFYQPGVEVIDDVGQVYSPTTDKVKQLLRPKKAGRYSGEKLATSLGHGNWLYFPSIMWRTDVLRAHRFDEKHDNTQDVILELSIITDGGVLYLDDAVTFQYRRSAKSFSSRRKTKVGGRFAEEAKIYRKFAKDFKKLGWQKAALSANLHLTSRLNQLMSKVSSGL